ncbi:MAG: kinase/pyrophosphorylase [Proteobacteria bacterium]|nr:kinase/pyrophosphorylase [Pseudomonadota bacterium]MDA1356220.1 kinase/pyrophosphorylase [Pseudomonadota bacterium]
MSVKSFHLHLVSDATGETVITVARGAVAQFSDVEAIEHLWSLVRSRDQLKRVLSSVAANPGVVMFTLVDQELRQALQEGCRELDIPCIPLLDMVIATLSQYLGVESQNLPGSQHVMDAHYLGRIDAMNFTLQHDDGQATGSLEGADIVLVGVSRSSKTPTCFYLANRGFKTANVPVVPGCPLPPELEFLKRPLVVGLTCGANQLVDIRRSRLRMIGQDEETEYVDPVAVREEVQHARRMFSRTGWPVIDVTNRSIEETAAAVLQLHAKHIDGED